MKTEVPMTRFNDKLSEPVSGTRFWTLMWKIKNHFGVINEQLVMKKFMTPHFFYDKDGVKHDLYDLDPYGKIPAHNAGATICRHTPGYPEPFIGGSNDVKLFSIDDRVIYWIQGRPCEWQGEWDHISLKN